MSTLAKLESVTGTLSKPSKMPCHSYSINPMNCKVGQKLAQIKGSTCNDCYACKGNYKRYSTTMEKAWNRREANLASKEWIDSMVELIEKKNKGNGYFRWHDSGDLQSTNHLNAIVEIANKLPHINFWLPTKEKKLINSLDLVPDNLTIRLSAAMVDGPAPTTEHGTATVTTQKASATCRSFETEGKCQDCRKCWNKEVKNIVYLWH